MIRKCTRILLLAAAALVLASPVAWAEEHEAAAAAAATPWDQAEVAKLSEAFRKHASDARTAIYNQGSTSGSVGSGSRRDFFRMRDKARIIDREARRFNTAIQDGQGHDETLPIFERLMVEVRDIRVIGRRVMIQEGTSTKIRLAGESLQQIAAYYDPGAFERGSAPPLGTDPRR